MSGDPVSLLAELLDSLDAGRVPSDDVRRWLADGIRSVVDGRSLDASLGLVKRGQRPIRSQLIQLRVDQCLQVAIRSAPTINPCPSWWDRCQVLAPLLSRYLAGSWRVDRSFASPPPGPPWQAWAWYAAKLGPTLPLTPRGLYAVLERVQANRLHPIPVSLVAHLMSYPCQYPLNASKSSGPSALVE